MKLNISFSSSSNIGPRVGKLLFAMAANNNIAMVKMSSMIEFKGWQYYIIYGGSSSMVSDWNAFSFKWIYDERR